LLVTNIREVLEAKLNSFKNGAVTMHQMSIVQVKWWWCITMFYSKEGNTQVLVPFVIDWGGILY
jgi:hypothetical protein